MFPAFLGLSVFFIKCSPTLHLLHSVTPAVRAQIQNTETAAYTCQVQLQVQRLVLGSHVLGP